MTAVVRRADETAGRLDSYVVPAPCDTATRRVRALAILAHVDDQLIRDVVAASDWLRVPAGVSLFRVGDPPDGMYGLVAGRMRFFVEEDGRPMLTAEASAGVTFGEGSLLIGGGRSRTAVVVRDAELVRVQPDRFQQLMATSPTLATSIAGSVAARFAFQDAAAAPAAISSIMVDVASSNDQVVGFVDQFQKAAGVDVAVVDHRVPSSLGVARQSDLLLIVRSGHRLPHDLDRLHEWHAGLDPLAAPPVELVLVHHDGARPSGTAAWRRAFPFTDHHHVEPPRPADVERLIRHLRGDAVGLVLSGGGARGMAHIGVLKAMAELSIPVDRIGGSSIGAIIGAQAALGRPWDEILETNRRAWTRLSLRLDVTFPTVSVSSGRRLRRVLDDFFDDIDIEDLWFPFFCTTVNLSRFRLEVHRQRHGQRDGSAPARLRPGCGHPWSMTTASCMSTAVS